MFFSSLLQITNGAAYTVTRATLDDNGFDRLRLLLGQFGKAERHTVRNTLMRIVLQQFDESIFADQLTKREVYMRLPGLLKTTLLVTETAGPLYRYLCMSIDDLMA